MLTPAAAPGDRNSGVLTVAKRRHSKKWFKGLDFSGLADLVSSLFDVLCRLFVPLLAVGLGAGLFFFVGKTLLKDTTLTVRQITVEPSDSLSVAARAELENRLLGKSILKIDLLSIARGMEQNPEIRRARITRRMPSTLKVDIETRKPMAYILTAPQGPYGLISEDGMILDVMAKPSASLLVVEAFDLGVHKPRPGYQIRNKDFLKAMRFLKAFSAHPFSRQETVTKIRIDPSGNVSVTLGDGPEIRLGRDPVDRLKMLEASRYVLERPDRNLLEYIDLQFENMVVKKRNK